LGSSDPLFDAKLLEFSYKQGGRQMITILHLPSEKYESGGYNTPKRRGTEGMERSDRVTLPEKPVFSDVKSIVPWERV
jgi:hypothetical protein